MNGALRKFVPFLNLGSLFGFSEIVCIGITNEGKLVRIHIDHIEVVR